MDTLTLIEQTAAQYRHLDLLGVEIEETIHSNELAAMLALNERLKSLQEQAQILDGQLLDALQQRHDLLDLDKTQEWLQLMQTIQERNQRLLPYIKSAMAIQRNELQTLQKGSSMLQGYKPGMVQIENHFSSSG
jgi:hypothetical protein